MGGQRQTEHGANDGAGRCDQRHRQGQAQIGEVTPQQTGASGQRARKGHQQTSASHKVEVEGEKTAYQRHKQNAAAHTGHNGNHAEDKTEEQQGQRPVPPRMVVYGRCFERLRSSRSGFGGRGLHGGIGGSHSHKRRGLGLSGIFSLRRYGGLSSRMGLSGLRRHRAGKPQTQCHGQQNELHHRILSPALQGSLEIKSHCFPLAAFCRRKFIYGQPKVGWKGVGCYQENPDL